MAILSNGKFYGFLCSAKETGRKLANGAKEYVENFVSGFAGHGWKIWEYVKGKWMLEIDSIRVRGQFTVFELLVSKIRAIIGAQAITQGCGKIKSVELSEDGVAYLITLEDKDMSFMEHDFIRCQEFTGEQRTYHVEIESVNGGIIRIPLSEFDEDEGGFVQNPPKPGDDIVQFGNSSRDEKYVGRHSAIYMHADETAQPAIDVLDGIYSKDWSECLKVRMGGDIPGSNGLKGLYCVNGMIRGVDDMGHMTYCLYPDGTAELGDGSALFKPDKSGYIAGGAIAWRCEDGEDKYVVSMNDVQVEWDKIKDSPEWIDEWTANGTTIGEKFVASPTGFFGKKDSDTDKLTGILMGKDVLVNGVERTGIFALVDDEVVFELDPENKEYKFKGKIESSDALITGGQIGNLKIKGDSISSESDVQTKLLIGQSEEGYTGVAIYGGTRKKYPGMDKIHSNRIWIRMDHSSDEVITGLSLDNYGKDNVCIDILSNGGTAIRSYGAHVLKQRKGEIWDAPGVLWAGFFNCNNWSPELERSWGNGCSIKFLRRDRNGIYTFSHDLGHEDYYISAMVSSQARDNYSWWGMICTFIYLNKSEFQIQFRTTDGSEQDPLQFQLFVYGRNKV